MSGPTRTKAAAVIVAWLGFALVVAAASTGRVSANSETDHRVNLLGVCFTNVETVPKQLYATSRPQHVWPDVTVFDRAKDPRVILVVAFSSGTPRSLRAVLKAPSGAQRPVAWSIPELSRVNGGSSSWRTTTAW